MTQISHSYTHKQSSEVFSEIHPTVIFIEIKRVKPKHCLDLEVVMGIFCGHISGIRLF